MARRPVIPGRPFKGRTALLSPFDRLVHDRRRAEELFGFEYYLEMYKPAARRRWGYFALPILYGDKLVGKLDAIADRKAGVLRVKAVREGVAFTKNITAAVNREIKELARWLELDLSLPGRRLSALSRRRNRPVLRVHITAGPWEPLG